MWQFEQRANIKFCQKLGKSPSETFNMLKQLYGEEALGRSAARGTGKATDHRFATPSVLT
jgi:hypothetical protein